MLVIENGLGGALVYRALIEQGGRTGATDVCLVPPGKLGIEHWPFAIDSIQIHQMRLAAWKPGDPVTCE
ncbi:MAG: hypothetical protein WDN24_21525 [Sphingomonas sp.]